MLRWCALGMMMASGVSAAQTTGAFEKVAEVGDVLPGGVGEASALGNVVLNNHGHVAFTFSSDDNQDGRYGIAVWDGTDISIRELDGASAGLTGGEWLRFSNRPLNFSDDGNILFYGEIDPSPVPHDGVRAVGLSTPSAGLQTIWYEGMPLPGIDGSFANNGFRVARLNQSGQVALLADMQDTLPPFTDQDGIFLWDSGAMQRVFSPLDFGGDTRQSPVFDMSVNDQGGVAFGYTEVIAGQPTGPIAQVWRNGAATELLSFNGEVPDVPGAAFGGATTGRFINNHGDVAIVERLRWGVGGVDQFTDTGIWLYEQSLEATNLYVREGDTFGSGMSLVDNLSSLSGGTAMNDSRSLAIGSPFVGWYYITPSGVQLIGLAGQSPPRGDGQFSATGAAGNFAADNNGWNWLAMNAHGQVAFNTEIRFSSSGNDAICFYDPADGLSVVIRTGDALFGSLVTDLAFIADSVTGEEGTGFNNAGEIAFRYSLADGRNGIAFWDPNGIPCPADVNGNGVTDPGDFTAWVAAYNQGDPVADANQNGELDPGDFTAWVAAYNIGC